MKQFLIKIKKIKLLKKKKIKNKIFCSYLKNIFIFKHILYLYLYKYIYYLNNKFFFKNNLKKNLYINNKYIGYLYIKNKKNNIFGLLTNKKNQLKYWCTPASLKLIRKKKTKKFNIDILFDNLIFKLKRYKIFKLNLKFFGKKLNIKKLIKQFKLKNLKIKLLSIECKNNISFNGCKLSKKKRKRRRRKKSFNFIFRALKYKKKA
jgi:ribosomal protein S11